MSLKTWLTPRITERMFSEATLLRKRRKAEKKRQKEGRIHRVEYFHQVSDAYCGLTAMALEKLCSRYHIELICHMVPPPDKAAAPELDLLMQHSLTDARLLSERYQLLSNGFEHCPSKEQFDQAELALCQALVHGNFLEQVKPISLALWAPQASQNQMDYYPKASIETLKYKLLEGAQRRSKLGHYLGGTFFYEGEWYWGIDRLHYLEKRLVSLNLKWLSHKNNVPLFPPLKDGLKNPTNQTHDNQPVLEFFFSIRSPYSAIVAPRVFELAEETGARVEYRFVLPMVMRGLPVPKAKRQYIVLDTAREARLYNIPFGKMNDPVGKPTERVLAILYWAIKQGKAKEWLLSAYQGIWSEGVDAGSNKGLKKLVDRAGLEWEGAQSALLDNDWRKQAEINRQILFSNNLWGVPSFKVGDQMFWGQDRLWAVRDALNQTKKQTEMTV